MYRYYITEVLEEWKKEAKVKHIILFSYRKDTVTLYTDRPGRLIGGYGERIVKFTEKLKERSRNQLTKINIIETHGIV